MIKSMTGFGKSVCEIPNKKIHVEVRSLNGKQLDINLRMPLIYREKEHELRNHLASRLERGKVEMTITTESLVPENLPRINQKVFENYYEQLNEISNHLNIGGNSDFIRAVLTLPDVLKAEIASLDETEWIRVEKGLIEAVDAADRYRIAEGSSLQQDIISRLKNIAELMDEITPFEEQRLERIKERIRTSISEVVESNQMDENRFEQELIYYIEKLDMTEERVRLQSHLDYFTETMEEKQPVGKKLAFISQEIGREINTMGSKANDADIQRLVIRMKDELEKIKEQILNVL